MNNEFLEERINKAKEIFHDKKQKKFLKRWLLEKFSEENQSITFIKYFGEYYDNLNEEDYIKMFLFYIGQKNQ